MKRTPLKRKPTQRYRSSAARADEALGRRYWKQAVTRGGCVMCRHCPPTRQERQELGPIQGHHILPKADLKTYGHADKLWDVRNGMALCELHHTRHERWKQRVPFSLIPISAIEFAIELELEWLLARRYPQ